MASGPSGIQPGVGVQAHTMSPASRTFGSAGAAPRRASLAPVIAIGSVLALMGVAAVAYLALHQAPTDIASPAASDTASASPPAAATSAPAPVVTAPVELPSAATTPPTLPVPLPTRHRPSAPAVPTRTGKVKIPPPSP